MRAKHVWVVVDVSSCSVYRVFKSKRIAEKHLHELGTRKFGEFWATDKESIEGAYCYTLSKKVIFYV